MFHVKINEWLTSLKVDYVRPASVPAYGRVRAVARSPKKKILSLGSLGGREDGVDDDRGERQDRGADDPPAQRERPAHRDHLDHPPRGLARAERLRDGVERRRARGRRRRRARPAPPPARAPAPSGPPRWRRRSPGTSARARRRPGRRAPSSRPGGARGAPAGARGRRRQRAHRAHRRPRGLRGRPRRQEPRRGAAAEHLREKRRPQRGLVRGAEPVARAVHLDLGRVHHLERARRRRRGERRRDETRDEAREGVAKKNDFTKDTDDRRGGGRNAKALVWRDQARREAERFASLRARKIAGETHRAAPLRRPCRRAHVLHALADLRPAVRGGEMKEAGSARVARFPRRSRVGGHANGPEEKL